MYCQNLPYSISRKLIIFFVIFQSFGAGEKRGSSQTTSFASLTKQQQQLVTSSSIQLPTHKLDRRIDSGDSDYDNTPESNEPPSDPSIDPASLDAEAQLEGAARDRQEDSISAIFSSRFDRFDGNVLCVFSGDSNSPTTPLENEAPSVVKSGTKRSDVIQQQQQTADVVLPTQDKVVKKTETITIKIHELLQNAKHGKHEG